MLWKRLYEQLEIQSGFHKLVVRYAGRIVWCKADTGCRGRRGADTERCKRKRKLRSMGEAYLSLQICCE